MMASPRHSARHSSPTTPALRFVPRRRQLLVTRTERSRYGLGDRIPHIQ